MGDGLPTLIVIRLTGIDLFAGCLSPRPHVREVGVATPARNRVDIIARQGSSMTFLTCLSPFLGESGLTVGGLRPIRLEFLVRVVGMTIVAVLSLGHLIEGRPMTDLTTTHVFTQILDHVESVLGRLLPLIVLVGKIRMTAGLITILPGNASLEVIPMTALTGGLVFLQSRQHIIAMLCWLLPTDHAVGITRMAGLATLAVDQGIVVRSMTGLALTGVFLFSIRSQWKVLAMPLRLHGILKPLQIINRQCMGVAVVTGPTTLPVDELVIVCPVTALATDQLLLLIYQVF